MVKWIPCSKLTWLLNIAHVKIVDLPFQSGDLPYNYPLIIILELYVGVVYQRVTMGHPSWMLQITMAPMAPVPIRFEAKAPRLALPGRSPHPPTKWSPGGRLGAPETENRNGTCGD
jgi:hypothetical protein